MRIQDRCALAMQPLSSCNSTPTARCLTPSSGLLRNWKRTISADDFALLRELVEHLEKIWDQPDRGIWEVRGEPRHFTYSKVMAWVAFDRAIKIARNNNFEAPLERWKTTRDTIHKQVCEQAFNQQMNSFVQHYDGNQLDASLLLMSMVGFLPPEDRSYPRNSCSDREAPDAGWPRYAL